MSKKKQQEEIVENSEQQVLSAVEYEMDQIGPGEIPEEVKAKEKESE